MISLTYLFENKFNQLLSQGRLSPTSVNRVRQYDQQHYNTGPKRSFIIKPKFQTLRGLDKGSNNLLPKGFSIEHIRGKSSSMSPISKKINLNRSVLTSTTKRHEVDEAKYATKYPKSKFQQYGEFNHQSPLVIANELYHSRKLSAYPITDKDRDFKQYRTTKNDKNSEYPKLERIEKETGSGKPFFRRLTKLTKKSNLGTLVPYSQIEKQRHDLRQSESKYLKADHILRKLRDKDGKDLNLTRLNKMSDISSSLFKKYRDDYDKYQTLDPKNIAKHPLFKDEE